MAGLTDNAILEAWRLGGGDLEMLGRMFLFRFGLIEVREVLSSGIPQQWRLLTLRVLFHSFWVRPHC